MKISFDGVGQWGATFECADVTEGHVVQISAAGTVAKCQDGGAFAGVVLHVARDKKACTVQLGGVATVKYSGGAPAAGWTKLATDANGGVKTSESGTAYLVLDVDEAAETVTFVL